MKVIPFTILFLSIFSISSLLILIDIGAENNKLKAARKKNLETVISLSSQLNTCQDMLKVYKEVDLYAYPH